MELPLRARDAPKAGMDLAGADDADLARRSAGGDDGAFAELCRRHAGPLLGMARGWGLSDADAADVVQDALCKVLEKRHFLASVTRVRGWLYRVALNLVRSRARTAARHQRLLLDHAHDLVPVPAEPEPARHLDPARVQAVLSPRQRDVVALRSAGLTFAETARALGTSENACKVHFHHAVQRLRALVRETP